MKKNISLIIIAIFLAVNTFSQIYEPVKWTKELKITGERTADVIIHASIDEGWHLYGIHLPKDGPRATAIVFESVKNAQKVGELQTPSKLHKAYDANFDMELNWYTTQADFIQKISYTDISKVEVKGYIEFMACNDQSCLPPSQELFNLGAPAQAHPATLAVPLDSAKLTKVTDYWTPVINELKAFGE
ncbi:MAG: protein-disulfide reductase DsbD domain-containing protein, partial [Paludibacter sp.]